MCKLEHASFQLLSFVSSKLELVTQETFFKAAAFNDFVCKVPLADANTQSSSCKSRPPLLPCSLAVIHRGKTPSRRLRQAYTSPHGCSPSSSRPSRPSPRSIPKLTLSTGNPTIFLLCFSSFPNISQSTGNRIASIHEHPIPEIHHSEKATLHSSPIRPNPRRRVARITGSLLSVSLALPLPQLKLQLQCPLTEYLDRPIEDMTSSISHLSLPR